MHAAKPYSPLHFKVENDNQLRILQWNLQATVNCFYDAAMVIDNPFVLHKSIKDQMIIDTIEHFNPDVCTFCEALPIFEVYEHFEKEYQLAYTSLKTEFPWAKMEYGNETCVTAVMFRRSKLELVEQKDIYFAQMAVNKPLFESLGGKIYHPPESDPTKDFSVSLKPYSTYNTATLVLLRHKPSQRLIQCCAIYPNWNPRTEPLKMMSVIYAHSVI